MADSNITKMEERNLFSIWKGLTCIGNALQKYTERTFNDLQKSISEKLEDFSPCNNNCGEDDDHPKSWCDTCNAWKSELEQVLTYKTRNWRKEKPSKWGKDLVAVAHVFVPPGWDTVNFGDLSTLASLWRNCLKFATMSQLATKIDELSKIRNALAHNSKLAVTKKQMEDYLKVFDKFYSDDALKNAIDISVNKLRQIVNEKLSENNTDDEIKCMKADFAELKKRMEQIKDGEGILDSIFFVLKILLLGIFLLSCLVLSVMWVISQPDIATTNYSSTSKDYCLSEQYSHPFTPELQLEGYLTKHRHIVGRDWLIEEIQNELFELDPGKKGILLTADIGYGKTAFIARLVCAKESEAAWELHNRLLAYHVCRFDATSTKIPALFIRRLVGMIAKQIPEYRKHFSKLPNSSIIFDRHFCGLDPKGCFDQNILFPLQKLNKTPQEKRIIIIDALDECFDSVEKSNEISELIRHRAYELPSWIVLLVTSRNTSEARSFKDLRLKHLNVSDQRNFDDLKTYIKERQNQNVSILESSSSSGEVLIDELVNRSGGNFQFLTLIINHWLSTGDLGDKNDVPSTLDKIYELNFERIFGNDRNQFRKAKLILEVIAASINQVEVAELVEAVKLSNSTVLTDAEFEETLAKLTEFLKYDKGYVMFTHMSIYDWLLSGTNSKFSITLKNGYAIITNYLLHMIHRDNNSTSRLTQLLLYVSRSDNFELEEKFKIVTLNKTKEIIQNHVLHRIISITDSPKAVDLLFNHYIDFDVRDAKGMTASAYAVMNGHLRSLERLIHYGANVTAFIHEHYCKLTCCFGNISSFGYTLLHLAAQFGHKSIVDFILSKKKALMYSETERGYLPLHIACKYGQKVVVPSFVVNGTITPDAFCLYLAIKNKHMSIVHIILNTKVLTFSTLSERYIQDSIPSVRISNGTAFFYKDLAYLLDTLKFSWYLKGLPLYLSIADSKLSISHIMFSDMPIFLNCFNGERDIKNCGKSGSRKQLSLRPVVPCSELVYILKGPAHIAHTIDFGCYLDFEVSSNVSLANVLSSPESLNALGIALVKCSMKPALYIDINGKLSNSFCSIVNCKRKEFSRLRVLL